jgi:hypothetical protein
VASACPARSCPGSQSPSGALYATHAATPAGAHAGAAATTHAGAAAATHTGAAAATHAGAAAAAHAGAAAATHAGAAAPAASDPGTTSCAGAGSNLTGRALSGQPAAASATSDHVRPPDCGSNRSEDAVRGQGR